MKFIELTHEDGTKVFVNANSIIYFEIVRGKTVIRFPFTTKMNNNTYVKSIVVNETSEQILQKINS
jgi:uncharacterized protein YlzI (FlbEa/FlbD family)